MSAASRGPGLQRVLGFPGLLFYGVGLILGAGVYSIIGAAAGQAGDALWLAFLLAAAVALTTGLSYAELAAMFPRAGADYVYARKAFPRWRFLAATTGFLLAASAMATSATVSTAFSGYMEVFVASPAWLVAPALLILATALNILGIRHSSAVNIAMTLIEVGGLILVVVLGFTRPELANVTSGVDVGGVFTAAGLLFFAFLGFEDIANLAEEARDPTRNVPRAILLAVLVSTVLYVFVAIAAVTLQEPERLAESDAPLADAAATVHARFGGVLAGIAMFATANTALIALLAASRMLFGIGRGGDAPKFLTRTLPKRGTPWIASLTALGVALALLPLARVELLGSISSLSALGAFMLVNISLIRLRYTRPDAKRPFRSPLRIRRMPLLPLAGIAGALVLAATVDVTAMVAFGALAGVGLLVLRLTTLRKKSKSD